MHVLHKNWYKVHNDQNWNGTDQTGKQHILYMETTCSLQWKWHAVYIYQEPKTEMHIESWQNAVTHGKCSRQSWG